MHPRELHRRDMDGRPDAVRDRPLTDPTPGPPASAPRRAVTRRRIVLVCAAIAAALHTLAVLWTWIAWAPGVGSWWLVWLDFPVSLLYMHLMGGSLLVRSLLLGGLQWACTGALVAWLVGWAAQSRRP